MTDEQPGFQTTGLAIVSIFTSSRSLAHHLLTASRYCMPMLRWVFTSKMIPELLDSPFHFLIKQQEVLIVAGYATCSTSIYLASSKGQVTLCFIFGIAY